MYLVTCSYHFIFLSSSLSVFFFLCLCFTFMYICPIKEFWSYPLSTGFPFSHSVCLSVCLSLCLCLSLSISLWVLFLFCVSPISYFFSAPLHHVPICHISMFWIAYAWIAYACRWKCSTITSSTSVSNYKTVCSFVVSNRVLTIFISLESSWNSDFSDIKFVKFRSETTKIYS